MNFLSSGTDPSSFTSIHYTLHTYRHIYTSHIYIYAYLSTYRTYIHYLYIYIYYKYIYIYIYIYIIIYLSKYCFQYLDTISKKKKKKKISKLAFVLLFRYFKMQGLLTEIGLLIVSFCEKHINRLFCSILCFTAKNQITAFNNSLIEI